MSGTAIQKGIRLAKTIGAKVTGFYVAPKCHVFTYRTGMLEDTKKEYAKDCADHALQYLAVIEKMAKKAGVRCETISVTGDHPHEEIIKAAKKKRCDLIMMASHGRKGVRGLLLGSETQKVLTHSKILVVVCR